MSQLALGLGAGLGIWTVGMGATVLSGSSNNEEMPPFKQEAIKLNSVQDIKTRHKKLPCVSELFEKVEWKVKGSSATVSSLENTEVKGCLSVWWEKETYEKNWKGTWNLLWGMKNQSYGVVFLTDVKANEGKITNETALYLLKKEQEKWSLVSETALSKSEIKKGTNSKENSIAMPNTTLINASDGWNFDFDSENTCSSTKNCESETPEQESTNLNWNFVEGTEPTKDKEVPVYEWVKNIDSLILFGSTIKIYLSKINGYMQLE